MQRFLVYLFVWFFLLFSNQWQKILFLTQNILFPFIQKCQKKYWISVRSRGLNTPIALVRSWSIESIVIFILGFVVLVARGCGFVVDLQKPFAVKSQIWLEKKLSLLPCYFLAFSWMQCSTDWGRREHSELRLGSQVTDQNNLHYIHLCTSWPMVSSNVIFCLWLESF